MMTCHCTTNNLRLFIRSVTQVDLPSSVRYSTQQKSIRGWQSTRAFRGQPFSCRAFSSASTFRSPSNRLSESESKTEGWPQGAQSTPNEGRSGNQDLGAAFVELSPDAIDAIAAEATGIPYETEGEFDTPLKSLLQDLPERKLPQRKPRSGTAEHQLPRTTIRRTQTENKEFVLHFSSPRLPPLSPAQRPAQRPTSPSAINTLRGDLGGDGREKFTRPKREPWQIEKEAREEKYPDGWNPLKRLSPDAMAGIRAIHAQMPERYTTEVLAEEFKVSPEAIRRILKSKWRPNSEEETDRQRRWLKRGENAWGRFAEMGMKPPRQWRELGIGKGRPEWMLKKRAENAAQRASSPALLTAWRRRGEGHKEEGSDG